MNDLDDLLTEAFADLADDAPHDPDLAGRVRARARRGRVVTAGAVLAGAAAVVVAVAVGITAAPIGHRSASGPAATSPACASTVVRGVLPDWARVGFSDPEPVMPYVTSRSGGIVAILFTDRLTSPERKDVGNKVLWVWRKPVDPTTVQVVARLGGTGPAITAGLPSPTGPSYVDLPSPGCWRLTITWPAGSDTVDLTVVKP